MQNEICRSSRPEIAKKIDKHACLPIKEWFFCRGKTKKFDEKRVRRRAYGLIKENSNVQNHSASKILFKFGAKNS